MSETTRGLLTNRLLWLGASAGALPLRGSGCRNLALRAFVNKPFRTLETSPRIRLHHDHIHPTTSTNPSVDLPLLT
jgi:hypothetical protein